MHFFVPVLQIVKFYSWQVHLLHWAELAKHFQSVRFYAGNAALDYKETHNGNWAWLRTLRRGCVYFALILTPYLPPHMLGRLPCWLWAWWLGTALGTCKRGSFYAGALCPCPPRSRSSKSAGCGLVFFQGGYKETGWGCPCRASKRKCA